MQPDPVECCSGNRPALFHSLSHRPTNRVFSRNRKPAQSGLVRANSAAVPSGRLLDSQSRLEPSAGKTQNPPGGRDVRQRESRFSRPQISTCGLTLLGLSHRRICRPAATMAEPSFRGRPPGGLHPSFLPRGSTSYPTVRKDFCDLSVCTVTIPPASSIRPGLHR